jgi:hypothetical protein
MPTRFFCSGVLHIRFGDSELRIRIELVLPAVLLLGLLSCG